MGISMAVLKASDEELRAYARDPASLETRLNRTISSPSDEVCNLFDSWDGLHHMVATGFRFRLPMAALRRGEVSYSKGLSDPAHAIYSATVRRWSDQLESLSEDTLRQRFERLLDGVAKPRGVAGRMCGLYRSGKQRGQVDAWFGEMLGYFRALRAFVSEAAASEVGLIFCCWEDW